MSKIIAFTIVAVLILSAGTLAQDGEQVQKLLKQMETLRTRLDASDSREKHLQDRVDQLEGRLQQQKEAARLRAAQLELAQQETLPTNELAEALESLQQLQQSPAAHSALAVKGYFDVSFRDDQAKRNSTFEQQRLVLNFSGDILKDLISFKSEVELEGGGFGASFLSNSYVLVEYGEIHFHINRVFNIKAGALLVPFGRFNTLHDAPLRDLTDRPLVSRHIIPSTWTDSGVGIYGAWDMFGVGFDYDIILSNGLDDDFSSTPGGAFRGSRNSLRVDNNDSKMIIGRFGIRPDFDFFDVTYFGLSFGWGKYDDENKQNMVMFGFDWTVKKGDFELIGEYALYDLERSPREVALGAPGGAEGFYAQVNYHFFPDSWRGINQFFTEESTFTLVFRIGNMDTDDSATGIDRNTRGDGFRDDTWRYTIGLNFRPIEKTVITVEYQFWDEVSGIPSAENDRFVISFATSF